MEADLMVKSQGFQEIIDSLSSGLTDIKKEFDEVQHSHSSLGASWKGEASDAALTSLTGLEDDGTSHTDLLQKAIKALQDALDSYNKAEESVKELWAL